MNLLKKTYVIAALIVLSVVLLVIYFNIPRVSPKGDDNDKITLIVTLAGAVTTLAASVIGAMMKFIEYRKAVLDLKKQELEFERQKNDLSS